MHSALHVLVLWAIASSTVVVARPGALTERDGPNATDYQACSLDSFDELRLPGSQILSVTAVPAHSLTSTNATVRFCNATIQYSHDQWNDTITVTVWLPSPTSWSGRLIGAGGGGYGARSDDKSLAVEVAAERAVYATDAGHDYTTPASSLSWAYDAQNRLNQLLLQDFASVSLNDAAILAKQAAKGFYGRPARYTYWSGCSCGGQQGIMIAQRYPTAVDGILAGAPAVYWDSLLPAMTWPAFVLTHASAVPPSCVLIAFQDAIVQACDALDGVQDNIVSASRQCRFDSRSLVGQTIDCGDLGPVQVTRDHADIVDRIRHGPVSDSGAQLWYGLEAGAPLQTPPLSMATISCVGSAANCTVTPFSVANEWLFNWVLDTPGAALANLTLAQYAAALAASHARYGQVIGVGSHDLSGLKAAGGKLLMWHGLADPNIPPDGSASYYRTVASRDPAVADYFRYFEAPGVLHCSGGHGPAPANAMDALIAWVETGQAPDQLDALSPDGSLHRPLCPYPLVAAYVGGDMTKPSSFSCRSSF